MELRVQSLTMILLMALSMQVAGQPAAGPVTAGDIRSAARQFLQKYADQQHKQQRQVSFSVSHVDPRVQMAACNNPIKVSFRTDPMSATHVTLEAACSGKRPWRMFLGANIHIRARAYVARLPMARGTRVTPSMLKSQEVTLNQAHGAIFDTTEGLVGMQLVRAVSADTVMTSSLLEAPNLINQGDRVIIKAQIASIAVKTQGTALSDGHKGQQILVRNDRSKRTIKAIVTGPGKVSVPM